MGPDGKPWHSWRVLILPYLDEALSEQYRLDEPWDGPNNRKLWDKMPKTFKTTHRQEANHRFTTYLAITGDAAVWAGAEKRLEQDITDWDSETLLLVENDQQGVIWTEPRDLPIEQFDGEIDSPNGICGPYERPAAAFVDGLVVSFDPKTPAKVLRAMATRAGGERLDQDNQGLWRIIEDGRKRLLRKLPKE
ncbi:Uncharacterized protein OS=Pirellula staleyi (strain ATCC 27377 / DSM 6068 / ICPB 4128) GN=Psta_4167 PE=4 SV=1 [Tuwongella immobilis]|uniref:DUF1559 domain-containing protein n=1 Tax=Tuwongella immobilis TaxID=692036 RepID=A0A6C2YJE4_9BACT|nr:Uncharacterized protein OS=Pirellula staleyi (strain ATCC 27377 / DSM 6068 / ICPB 4128) GN=Psta_4167 PE=4 SV=1 [Tuwongella immobilis]VTR98544.1 Uncharacterized protein OS=Pirellula staleyi (strain ATCC 27377 / DSM 6068 / ICPB 4128) GN=Psta_4167 PE=4 SV=1 [Tuwongella immobilis]